MRGEKDNRVSLVFHHGDVITGLSEIVWRGQFTDDTKEGQMKDGSAR